MNINFSQSLVQYSTDIDATLKAAKRYIVSENISIDFMKMEDGDGYNKLQEIQSVGAELMENLITLNQIDALFLYDGNEMLFVQNYNGSYKKNLDVSHQLEKQLRQMQDKNQVLTTDYQVIKINHNYYFYFANDIDGGVLGCWFSAEKLLDDLRNAKLEGAEFACFTDTEGRILSENLEIPEEELYENYSVTQHKLSEAPFALTVLWDEDIVYRTLNRIEKLTFGVTLLSTFLVIMYISFLRKSLFIPLKQMVIDIDRLKVKKFQPLRIQGDMSEEFRCVYDALNSMTAEIKDLKINVYEKKIQQQKVQMELYQLQVRPHFFQNALLTIRSFSQERAFEKIEQMTNLMLRHCQYILYSNWFVLLDEELCYIQNYLELQSIQHEIKYQYFQSCPEELLDYEIPILVVQVFVENAVKYAHEGKKQVEIEVNISSFIVECRLYLKIEICDTGAGMSQEILDKLNNGESLRRPGERHGIGIDNVRQRLRLIYGEEAHLYFCSEQGKGTKVEISFPAEHGWKNHGEGQT